MQQKRAFFDSTSAIWYIVAFIAVIAVPVVLMVAKVTERQGLQRLHSRADYDLRVQLAYTHSQLSNIHVMTRLLGSDERVRKIVLDHDDKETQHNVNLFLKRYLDDAGVIAYILDMQGTVVASGNADTVDSFVGKNFSFRPYFKQAVQGLTAQYVAIGKTSAQLGYYLADPILYENTIIGVVATKTDPQKLLLDDESPQVPFVITDADGIVIIGKPDALLLHSLYPLNAAARQRIEAENKYNGVDFLSLLHSSTKPVQDERQQRVHATSVLSEREDTLFVMSSSKVAATDWHAYVFWPCAEIKISIYWSVFISVLVLGVLLLLVLFVTEHWHHLRQIHAQALRDPLTQLYTRLYMMESVPMLLAAHDRKNVDGVGAILFDLDHFKSINDRFGHGAGDHVLVEVSSLVLRECRSSDIAIRYGGEELLLFVASGDSQHVVGVAERIREHIHHMSFFLGSTSLNVSISGGVACHGVGESLDSLIKRADEALYRAKQQGRNRICVHDANCIKSNSSEH